MLSEKKSCKNSNMFMDAYERLKEIYGPGEYPPKLMTLIISGGKGECDWHFFYSKRQKYSEAKR